MKFGLVRPCKLCPFRKDIRPYLTPGRATEIAGALLSDRTFSCHETNSWDEDGETLETSESHHCAGALIMLERNQTPNQMMRWMERINMYDREKLDMSSPVFESFKAFVRAQPDRQTQPPHQEVTAWFKRIR